jgi:hypothetical protein
VRANLPIDRLQAAGFAPASDFQTGLEATIRFFRQAKV